MSQEFVPPNFEAVPNQPSNPGQNGNFNAPNLPNSAPRQENREQMGQFAKSVARSAKIKKATTSIIKTRQDFKNYLLQNGMDLFTSAVEFQATGDFIKSSYVIYKNHQNYQESLVDFLTRYPNLQQPVMQINEQLRPQQQNMQVLTPKLSNPNPFEQFSQ